MTRAAVQEQYEPQSAADGHDRPLASSGALAAYSSQQQFALTRYARFAMLRRQMLPELEVDDWRTRLIHKALYSAYLDCAATGVSEEARLFGIRDTASSG